MLLGEPLVAVSRGSIVESVHAVAACAVDAGGRVLVEMGSIDEPVLLRSSAKPFIAAAVVRSGAADAFGFDVREIALAAASHNGEPLHVATVRSMLAKADIPVSALRCGAHAPSYEPAAAALREAGVAFSALHNNCSGKHAAILAMAKHMGADLDTYLDVDHPAQRAILDLCERAVGERLGPGRLAVDGCGIPVFATSLRNAAHAFGWVATLDAGEAADLEALWRVRSAMVARPWFVAGTDRFDTALMDVASGSILCKAGAEGVHCTSILDRGIGVAIKVVDGARRAAPPAAIDILGRLGALTEGQRESLHGFAHTAVRNVAGQIVGEISATPRQPVVSSLT